MIAQMIRAVLFAIATVATLVGLPRLSAKTAVMGFTHDKYLRKLLIVGRTSCAIP